MSDPENQDRTLTTPVIGLPGCRHRAEPHIAWRRISDGYLDACVLSGAGLPLVIPGSPFHFDPETICANLDGLMLTGSVSDIEPHWYGHSESRPEAGHDAERDQLVFRLIRHALQIGLPLLGICRGFQEMNIALGGSLHPRLHAIPGFLDHRSPKGNLPQSLKFAPAHPVSLPEEGKLSEWMRQAGQTRGPFLVNSLHGQGIDRLAPGAVPDAIAPDGVIEAFHLQSAPALGMDRISGFACAIQWHAELDFCCNPLSACVFQAFVRAVHAWHRARQPRSRQDKMEECGGGRSEVPAGQREAFVASGGRPGA